MWGFPTIMSRALGRVTATLKRFGFDRKPSVLWILLFSTDSFERTYNLGGWEELKNQQSWILSLQWRKRNRSELGWGRMKHENDCTQTQLWHADPRKKEITTWFSTLLGVKKPFPVEFFKKDFQCVEILYSVPCAYRGNDDDQELLSLKLLHRAHLNVRQAHLTEKNPNLLALKRNYKLRASLRKTTLFSTKALPWAINNSLTCFLYGAIMPMSDRATGL